MQKTIHRFLMWVDKLPDKNAMPEEAREFFTNSVRMANGPVVLNGIDSIIEVNPSKCESSKSMMTKKNEKIVLSQGVRWQGVPISTSHGFERSVQRKLGLLFRICKSVQPHCCDTSFQPSRYASHVVTQLALIDCSFFFSCLDARQHIRGTGQRGRQVEDSSSDTNAIVHHSLL